MHRLWISPMDRESKPESPNNNIDVQLNCWIFSTSFSWRISLISTIPHQLHPSPHYGQRQVFISTSCRVTTLLSIYSQSSQVVTTSAWLVTTRLQWWRRDDETRYSVVAGNCTFSMHFMAMLFDYVNLWLGLWWLWHRNTRRGRRTVTGFYVFAI